MNRIWKAVACGVLALGGLTTAQAAGVTVVCGNSSLGIRTTTIDPALAGSCFAGLQNPGDPALEALVNTTYGITNAALLDRDTANSNGGFFSITGVGLGLGDWEFNSSAWSTNQRLFLFFHFGDGPDEPSTTSTTDPDAYIVELVKPDFKGTWSHFDGTDNGRQQYGLSNVALIRGGECTTNCGGGGGGGGNAPEPASLALVALGLLGAAATRRRKA